MAGGDDDRGSWPGPASEPTALLHIAGAGHDGRPVAATALARSLRAGDTVVPRAGGGFAVRLARTTPAEAAVVAARLAATLGAAVRVATPADEDTLAAG